ncbi:MAG: HEAT repeat domain-containing protein [Planctomycetes bacterium]|nr:HEAT repeat domain-containing protein [Planctomycetota bacterium]
MDAATTKLVRPLEDSEKIAALRVLAGYGPSAAAAAPTVAEIFRGREKSGELRREALLAVAALADPRAIPALLDALGRDDDPFVAREKARTFEILARLSGQSLGTDLAAWIAWWEEERRVSRVHLYRCSSSGRLWMQGAPFPRQCPFHLGTTPECGEAVAALGPGDFLVYTCSCTKDWRQPVGERVRCPGCSEDDGCGTLSGFERAAGDGG